MVAVVLLSLLLLTQETQEARDRERKVPRLRRDDPHPLRNAPRPRARDQGNSTGCEFPKSWRGDAWFLSGSRENTAIGAEQFGAGAWCYTQHPASDSSMARVDRKNTRLKHSSRKVKRHLYTVMKRPEKCWQCLAVWSRHPNLLQYTLGPCVSTLASLDCSAAGDTPQTPLHTLLRLDGPDAPCPFSGAFNFTYKTEGKECGSSRAGVSRITRCMTPAMARLTFQVCPQDEREEDGDSVFYNTIIGLDGDSQETLTCKATWVNELNEKETYMMGTLDFRYKRTDEERVRCFLVQETKRGIQVAQSSDGTCYNNLQSSQSGHRTLKLDKVADGRDESAAGEEECHYPDWVAEMGPVFSFSLSSKYEVVEGGRVLSLSNYSTVSRRSHELSRTQCLGVVEQDDEAHYAKLVTRVVAGCDHMFKCLRMFRRTENIMEIQEGSPTTYQVAACSPQNFDERLMIYTTLFKERLAPQPCPVNGVHNVSSLDLDGQSDVCAVNGFTNIDIRCKAETTVEFYKQCPSTRPQDQKKTIVTSSASYQCLGGWSEVVPLSSLPDPGNLFLSSHLFSLGSRSPGRRNMYTTTDTQQVSQTPNVTIGYVVAMRAGGRDQKRICFIYMKMGDGGDTWGTQYSWTVDKTACLRNIRPGFGSRQRFNTTILETCGCLLHGAVWWRSLAPATILLLLSLNLPL